MDRTRIGTTHTLLVLPSEFSLKLQGGFLFRTQDQKKRRPKKKKMKKDSSTIFKLKCKERRTNLPNSNTLDPKAVAGEAEKQPNLYHRHSQVIIR